MGCAKPNPKLCLNPAELKHRVTIQSVTRTSAGGGCQDETWTDEATVWAAIDATGGGEAFTNGQMETRITHKVRLRYIAGLSTEKRLKFGERIFSIKFVRNIEERNRVLELKCEEGASDA